MRALMNLLLLLTALIASLTGVGAGERAMGQVQGVAVVRAAEVAQAAVRAARPVAAIATPVQQVRTAQPSWAITDTHSLPAAHLPFERRLE